MAWMHKRGTEEADDSAETKCSTHVDNTLYWISCKNDFPEQARPYFDDSYYLQNEFLQYDDVGD